MGNSLLRVAYSFELSAIQFVPSALRQAHGRLYALDGGWLDGAFPFSSAPIASNWRRRERKIARHPPTLERVPIKYAGYGFGKK